MAQVMATSVSRPEFAIRKKWISHAVAIPGYVHDLNLCPEEHILSCILCAYKSFAARLQNLGPECEMENKPLKLDISLEIYVNLLTWYVKKKYSSFT
jgi:hypothetical protein